MRTPPIRSDPGRCRSASSLGLIGAGKSQQQGGKHRRRRTRGGAYRTVPDVCSVLFRIHFHRAYLCHYYELLYHHFVRNQAFLPKKTGFRFDQRRHGGAADRFTGDRRRAVPSELHAFFRRGRGVCPAGGFQRRRPPERGRQLPRQGGKGQSGGVEEVPKQPEAEKSRERRFRRAQNETRVDYSDQSETGHQSHG